MNESGFELQLTLVYYKAEVHFYILYFVLRLQLFITFLSSGKHVMEIWIVCDELKSEVFLDKPSFSELLKSSLVKRYVVLTGQQHNKQMMILENIIDELF